MIGQSFFISPSTYNVGSEFRIPVTLDSRKTPAPFFFSFWPVFEPYSTHRTRNSTVQNAYDSVSSVQFWTNSTNRFWFIAFVLFTYWMTLVFFAVYVHFIRLKQYCSSSLVILFNNPAVFGYTSPTSWQSVSFNILITLDVVRNEVWRYSSRGSLFVKNYLTNRTLWIVARCLVQIPIVFLLKFDLFLLTLFLRLIKTSL